MPRHGPWITPTTTRFGGIGIFTDLPDLFVATSQGDDWDTARDGLGTTSSFEVAAAGSGAEVLHYLNFPSFTRFTVGQALCWQPLPALGGAADFPPYVDVSTPPHAVGVEYEAAAGTIVASPNVRVTAITGGGNTNLPSALIDVYQIPEATIGSTPMAAYQDDASLAALSSYIVGSIDSAGPSATFTGFAMSAADALVLLMASRAQLVTPFPYATPDPSGFQQFATLSPQVEYLGPRFRFLYAAAPRLRQFPRDDALGGAPRQGKANGSTSVQASTRQGWRGTYR